MTVFIKSSVENIKLDLVLSIFLIIAGLGLPSCAVDKTGTPNKKIIPVDKAKEQIIQLAELEIDIIQLEAYLEYLNEEIQTSLNVELGVLMLYGMSEKETPTQIKLVEIYANQAAYESHIASPYFQKYKIGTADMVKSLKLTRMNSIDALNEAKESQ